jgi:NADPH:quinone reductase-like Zn-dependent oxidoreductase
MSVYLGLDRPSLTVKAQPKGESILIYGGSSSAGGIAIRYAVAAGYIVTTTSSPKHHDYVKSLGATTIIDHTQPREAIIKDLRSQGPYLKILDTIGLPPVTELISEYIYSLGGGSYVSLTPLVPKEQSLPESVERIYAPFGAAFEKPENKELKEWLYRELLPKGLASGVIVPTRPRWLSGGLKGSATCS